MAALIRSALAALLLSAPVHSASSPIGRWIPFIAEASLRFRIPEAWIEKVMLKESGGQAGELTSPKGAMGLMQLMPKTWAAMRQTVVLGANPFDPHDNVLAGAAYLRILYDRFGYPGLFAAYNAGPRRYEDYLARGKPLPAETLAYLKSVAPQSSARASISPWAAMPRLGLFVTISGSPSAQTIWRASRDLFAIRK